VDDFFAFDCPEGGAIDMRKYKYDDVIGLFKRCVSKDNERMLKRGFE
jgi:hypothetical protein